MKPFLHRAFAMEVVMQTGTFILATMPEIGNKLLIFNSCKSVEIGGYACLGDILDTEVFLLSYQHGIAKIRGQVGKRAFYDIHGVHISLAGMVKM